MCRKRLLGEQGSGNLSAFPRTVPHNFSSYNVFCLKFSHQIHPWQERNEDIMAPSALPAEVATLVTEALCTLLVIGQRPLFRPCPPGAQCPASFCGLCVSTVPPSVLSNTSDSCPLPQCFLPAPRGNQDAPHVLGSARHASCSAFNRVFTHRCNFYLCCLF